MAYHNKGRPTKEQVKIRLHYPDILETEINELRNKLRLSLDKKLLMLVSIATDDMIRMVTMHPEVWFMDVTGGTNHQNRDLFMMATRWPTGETFPGNLTVFPLANDGYFIVYINILFWPCMVKLLAPETGSACVTRMMLSMGPLRTALRL